MAINFNRKLAQALENINSRHYYHFLIHDQEEERIYSNSDEIITKYADAKWSIIELINARFNSDFDLHNWISNHKTDEVAYFLNEAGSNSLNHSQFKTPYKFHLWMGEKGFIIGIEQKGKGFNAQEVNEKKIKDHLGKAFTFFRDCHNEIFFDNGKEARTVYLIFTL